MEVHKRMENDALCADTMGFHVASSPWERAGLKHSSNNLVYQSLA